MIIRPDTPFSRVVHVDTATSPAFVAANGAWSTNGLDWKPGVVTGGTAVARSGRAYLFATPSGVVRTPSPMRAGTVIAPAMTGEVRAFGRRLVAANISTAIRTGARGAYSRIVSASVDILDAGGSARAHYDVTPSFFQYADLFNTWGDDPFIHAYPLSSLLMEASKSSWCCDTTTGQLILFGVAAEGSYSLAYGGVPRAGGDYDSAVLGSAYSEDGTVGDLDAIAPITDSGPRAEGWGHSCQYTALIDLSLRAITSIDFQVGPDGATYAIGISEHCLYDMPTYTQFWVAEKTTWSIQRVTGEGCRMLAQVGMAQCDSYNDFGNTARPTIKEPYPYKLGIGTGGLIAFLADAAGPTSGYLFWRDPAAGGDPSKGTIDGVASISAAAYSPRAGLWTVIGTTADGAAVAAASGVPGDASSWRLQSLATPVAGNIVAR